MTQPRGQPATLGSHDLLVVGSGVAGLRAAIEAAAAGLRVGLITKDAATDSNTKEAQGGIAVALGDEDEVGLHLRDTIAAGDGLCDEAAVAVLVEEGPRYIMELIDWGARFDREGARLAFAREGAHSARRVLHAAGDSTGQEIVRALLEKASTYPGIVLLPKTYTVDLVIEEGRCRGILCLDERTGKTAVARGPVLLATGGCGQVYRDTTNPPQATGDGLAMAYRAGAWVRDMEFVQFHPTSLALPGAPRFLLSEALRGEGGQLKDAAGRRFMLEVDPQQAELAPRDVVARAISRAVAASGGKPVYLDLRHLGGEFLARRFPRIHRTCLGYGLDIAKDLVPVVPSAHYMMGGVATDLKGRASISGLYAAGEAACTGVHGANRLASNSLLEGLVFGALAGKAAVADAAGGAPAFDPGRTADLPGGPPPLGAAAPAIPDGEAGPGGTAEAYASQVREIVSEGAGILRDAAGLRRAAARLTALAAAGTGGAGRAGIEARNLGIVASLVVASAVLREESRGAHFRTDHPGRDDARFRRSFLLDASGDVQEVVLGQGAPGPGQVLGST